MKNDDIKGLLDSGLIGIPVDCAASEAINAAREYIDRLEKSRNACLLVCYELKAWDELWPKSLTLNDRTLAKSEQQFDALVAKANHVILKEQSVVPKLAAACRSVAAELLDRHDAIILGARGTPLGTRHEDYKMMALVLLDALKPE